MKSRHGPRIELTTVLLHEYRRASLALQEFHVVVAQLIDGHSAIDVRLAAYDSYGRFVHHLFEFYKGCIQTDGSEALSITGEELDRKMQAEVVKLMGHRAGRIARRGGEACDNAKAYSTKSVPAEFAQSFRLVRNQLAHASVERANANNRVSLPNFYVLYHRFALLLYEEPFWLWHAKEESSVDWKEIGRFEDAVKLVRCL